MSIPRHDDDGDGGEKDRFDQLVFLSKDHHKINCDTRHLHMRNPNPPIAVEQISLFLTGLIRGRCDKKKHKKN